MNIDLRQIARNIVLWTVLVVALATAVSYMPGRWAELQAILPVVGRWPDLDGQYRAQLKGVPYDLLRTADALVPRDASVLLVTSGRDVTRSEYITYHRALYFLTPRQVWWLSPAPPDGTWKSRWWVSKPLTAEAIKSEAASRGVTYVVLSGVTPPLDLGIKIADAPDGSLVSLTGDCTSEAASPVAQSAGLAWPLQIMLASVIMLAIGSVIVNVVLWLGYSPGTLEGLALAWSIGAGITSVLMLWLSALGLSLQWQLGVITCLAVAGVAWVVRDYSQTTKEPPVRRQLAETYRKERGWTKYFRWPLSLLMGVQIALVTVTATGRPLDVWDSWVNWAVKARIIFLDGYISPAVYADPSRAVSHLDYPLLLPLIEAWFYGWLGAPDDRFAGVASVLFYLALMVVCFTAMTRGGSGKTAALAATAVIVMTSHLLGLASLVLAEMPLTLYCTIAGVYLVRWLEAGSLGALALASVAGGLIPWTKKEGIVLLAVLVVATLVMNIRRRRAWQAAGAMLLAAGVIAGPWWLFITYNGIGSPDFSPVTLETLQANIGRGRTIARTVLDSLLGSRLSYIWPLTAVGGAIIYLTQLKRVGKRVEDFFLIAALMFVGLMMATYFFSDYVPYTDHILTSVDRLILPVTPLIVIWFVLRASATGEQIEAARLRD